MEDVARLTKLRTDQVLAIEEGRYQVFSAPVYVRGSVKSYAKLVQLDPSELVEQLNQEMTQGKSLNDPNPCKARIVDSSKALLTPCRVSPEDGVCPRLTGNGAGRHSLGHATI